MIKEMEHVGIVVRDMDKALWFYREMLGLKIKKVEEIPARNIKVAFIDAGTCEIELLQPTHPDAPIAKHLEENGEGIHHFCLLVEGIDGLMSELKSKGVKFIDEKPRPGAGGGRIAFIDPESAGGVRLEFRER